MQIFLWINNLINRYNVKRETHDRKYKTIKASVTLNNLGEETEVRIGFIGLEMDEHDYGVMLKRTFVEVRKQVLMREGS